MWTQITIRVPREAVAEIEALLESHDALSVSLTDPEDHPVLEPGVGETPLWPTVQVTGLFHAGFDFEPLIKRLPAPVSRGDTWIDEIGDQDWERAWLDDFKPMRFGETLWTIPGGLEPPDAGAINIQLDPGLAFGSGTHPTTRLCLEWIDGNDFHGLSVVDFGCGSGILGIAVALKGAESVLCVDNDPQALTATGQNAERNRVEGRVAVLEPARFDGQCVDVILANILAGTLVQLAPLLCSALKPGGRMVLSGILAEQAGQVREAYLASLDGIKVQKLEDWVLISGRKRETDIA